MEGKEQIALDIVTGYRGLLGGLGVAVTSSMLRNYNKKSPKIFTFKSFIKSSPLIVTVPFLMIAIRRVTDKFGGEDEEKN